MEEAKYQNEIIKTKLDITKFVGTKYGENGVVDGEAMYLLYLNYSFIKSLNLQTNKNTFELIIDFLTNLKNDFPKINIPNPIDIEIPPSNYTYTVINFDGNVFIFGLTDDEVVERINIFLLRLKDQE